MTRGRGLPPTIPPMLAEPAEPFDDPRCVFEVKWDGMRCIAFRDGNIPGGLRLQSRGLRDVTARFPDLAGLRQAVRGPGVVLDGEIVAFHDDKPSFLRLQPRIHARTESSIRSLVKEVPVVFVAFDILYLDGRPVMGHEWGERREMLADALSSHACVQLSEATEGCGIALFEAVKEMGLEGIVGKVRDGAYLPGKRSRLWRKVKALQRGHFLVCGYTVNPTGRNDLSSLALAGIVRGQHVFSGLVGAGLSQSSIDELLHLLAPLHTGSSPEFAWPTEAPTGVRWVRPELVCEVEYLEVTPGGQLRHPVFRGLRRALGSEDCIKG